MEKSTQTFSKLLLSVEKLTPSSPSQSPPLTPPASFTYVPESIYIPSSFIYDSKMEPYSFSPPKSFTTSAPVKAQTFDELIDIKPKPSFSNELRKSIRLSSKPLKTSYIDLEDEIDSCMKAQNPTKRLKQSSAFSPYDRKTAKKEKLHDDIVPKPIVVKETVLTNPYLNITVPESQIKRPLSETKSFDFDDIKKKKIQIDEVLQSIGWKDFCALDEIIYPDLVQEFYSSATPLEGHDVIICQMNQTNIYITTDILAKVFNLPNSGVKLYGKKWYDEVNPKLNRDSVLSELFDIVTIGSEFPVTDLKNEYKIIHNLCAHSLLPRSRNKYKVNDTDIMIIYQLTHGNRVNLPYVIIQHMMNALMNNNGNDGLPYAMPLTRIFKEFKMSFIGEIAKKNKKQFGAKNISHIKLSKNPFARPLHDIPLSKEAFVNQQEEENPLLSLVNAIIVENHLSSQSAPSNSHVFPKNHEATQLVVPNVSTDLKLSIDGNVEPNPAAPLFDCENSALFGSSCLNKFINSPKNDTPLLSDLPIPSHFSSFDSFKSTGTSPKRDPPIEPENSAVTNEMLLAEIASLRGDVNNLRESFVSFMFQYLGMMPPVSGRDPGSSSNPPPNQH